MKKFNKNIKKGTLVQLAGEYGFRKVKKVHDTRQWIEIKGLCGEFQKGHIIKYSNTNQEMYPAVDDLYISDQYGSVLERNSDCNMFIGKLNGQTLKQFVNDLNLKP